MSSRQASPSKPIRVNLIGNPTSPGLLRDERILRGLLESIGCQVHSIDMFAHILDQDGRGADLNIFLESLHDGRYLRGHAQSNWLFVNPEWYFPERWDRFLPLVSLVCCKTAHAYRVMSERYGRERCLYTAFESLDLYHPEIGRNAVGFLHVCGKSQAKGTEAIAAAWQMGLTLPLTVVTCAMNPLDEPATTRIRAMFFGLNHNLVRCLHNISDDRLVIEMNRCRFVLQPSMYEGWGHALHEAMSAKCVVITTDDPPMNEFLGVDGRLAVPVVRRSSRELVAWSHVSCDGVREAVIRAGKMGEFELNRIGEQAREGWLAEKEFFRETMSKAVKGWFNYI